MPSFKADPADVFWLPLPSPKSPPCRGFEAHCRNAAGHLALRELAGIAIHRKLSQRMVAEKYALETGKTITQANVTDAFRRKRPQTKTLAVYAAIMGMDSRHLSLLQNWPSLKWPAGGLGRFDWFDHHLGLDRMRPLFHTGEALRKLRQWANDEASRGDATQLVNVVELETERILARDYLELPPLRRTRGK